MASSLFKHLMMVTTEHLNHCQISNFQSLNSENDYCSFMVGQTSPNVALSQS